MKIDIGGGYYIRNHEFSDIPSIVKYANNKNVSRNLRDRFPYPYTEKDAVEWIEYINTAERDSTFAIASETEIIGGIGLEIFYDVFSASAEIGYWLGEPFWGKGIATRALKHFVKYAFDNFDIVRLQAGIFSSNAASKRVLEKAGFRQEGTFKKAIVKDNEYYDLFVYALLKEEFTAQQAAEQ